MKLFGQRQSDTSRREIGELGRQLSKLELEVDKIRSAYQLLQTEQDTVHTEVRKWMRRAENAERRILQLADRNQEPTPDGLAPSTSVTPRRRLWGARARIAERRARAAALPALNGSGDHVEVEETDGSDS